MADNVIVDPNSFNNPYYVRSYGYTGMAPSNSVTSGFSIPGLSIFNGLGDWLSQGDNLKGLGELTQGISGVLSYLNGRKGLALARDQLDTAKNQWLAGYNNEVQLQNNKTRDILGSRLMQNTGSKDNLEQEYNLRRLNTLNSI